MAGYPWVEEEEILVMWYASLGLNHNTIASLLRDRGFLRTTTAVRNKIDAIRKEKALGINSHSLNPIKVDEWIGQSCQQCDVARLLFPTQSERSIVNVRRTHDIDFIRDSQLILDPGTYRDRYCSNISQSILNCKYGHDSTSSQYI